jgi:hypothetical protein
MARWWQRSRDEVEGTSLNNLPNELRQQAVPALSDSLGPVDALRFLALVSREPFDYQQWRKEYFSHYSVDELLTEVRNHGKAFLSAGPITIFRFSAPKIRHFDVFGIPKNVVRTVLVFRARSLGGNRNEKRRGPGCIQAGASVSAQNLLDD